jgi:hypothetical protein
MPRTTQASLDDIVKHAMERVVKRTSQSIARKIAAMVAERLEAELRAGAGPRRRGARPAARKARRAGDITKWVADRRARRVPTFVIEQTGLKTKKQIVARYGESAAFEKGKAPPKAK